MKSLLATVWGGVKATVKVIQGFGTAMLGLFAIIALIALWTASRNQQAAPNVPKGAVMVLWPNGAIVEQAELADPFEAVFARFNDKRPETGIHDLLDAVRRAKTDDRIAAMALFTDTMWSARPSHLHTLAGAIQDFRESGKKVYAISTSYSQTDFLLAAQADKIFLNPAGNVFLTGYGQYNPYFKSLLDKLGVSVNVFRVGTYKSAVEPFTRDDMSEDAREANRGYLETLWRLYGDAVGAPRGMTAAQITQGINDAPALLREAGGDMAQMALNKGLVDAIATRADWRQELMDTYGTSPDGNTFNQIHWQAYLQATDPGTSGGNTIAVITAQGEIIAGEGPVTVTAAETLIRYIREARTADDVSAIVLRVDSPGGSGFASELIRQELATAQADGIPVVASFGPLAASGGYWISATADEIWSAPSTITGSIGIFAIVPTFENTLDKVGIHTDGVGTTAFAGALDTSRPLSDRVKDVVQQSIDAGYRDFLELVARGRGLSVDEVNAIAQGRVWSGIKAQEIGLVDHLGGLDEAVAAAARLAGVETYETVFYREQPDPFDAFLADLFSSFTMTAPVSGGPLETGYGLVGTLDATAIPPSATLKSLYDLQAGAEQILRLNDPHGRYFLCLECAVR